MNDKRAYRFAVVEDIPEENDVFKGIIKTLWPDSIVDQYFDFPTAFEAVSTIDFDVVVTDVNLGGGTDTYGGAKIAKALDSQHTPLIIVSHLPEPKLHSDIFMALGAWDYLKKPVRESEFQKQLELAVAYRCGQLDRERIAQTRESRIGDPRLAIDLSARAEVTWDRKRVHLTLTQIRIVDILSRNPNVPIKYADIFELIDSGRNRENLRVHIMAIRDAFKYIDHSFNSISSVAMFGYIWRA